MRNAMFFLCCLLVSSNALSQTKMPELLQRIHRQLSAAEHISYQYTVEQRLDDGQQNRVKGTLSRAKDYLAEINPEQTIIQTAQWYYKLDHGSKSIFISLLNFNLRASGLLNRQNSALCFLIDSD